MVNDEKIDINLSDNLSNSEMTAEEQYQMNYETALRYVNIAEHMKQFEDQDKYYHRAIQYLKMINTDRSLTPQIKELRKKKFGARVDGKIDLYTQACNIRDNAKTPQDYYSAQTIFLRIHAYEAKHPIPQKWVSPEKYQKALECTDSAEQAEYCAKKAAEKEAEAKRHSLFASILFVLTVIALLIFSKTILFHHTLASIHVVFRNYADAAQQYKYIYEQNNDSTAHKNYLTYRYKAAGIALKDGEINTAYDYYKSLAAENYKDSQHQFYLLQQKRTLTNLTKDDIGKVIHFSSIDWRVLDLKKDRVLVLKEHALGTHTFNDTDVNCTWETSSARKWLNNDFLTENFYQDEINAIIPTKVVASSNPTYSTPGGNDTTDKLFLLSAEEVKKYRKAIHKTETCWWLRTPGAVKNTMCFVYHDKTLMDYGYEVSNKKITLKPAMWISIDNSSTP